MRLIYIGQTIDRVCGNKVKLKKHYKWTEFYGGQAYEIVYVDKYHGI